MVNCAKQGGNCVCKEGNLVIYGAKSGELLDVEYPYNYKLVNSNDETPCNNGNLGIPFTLAETQTQKHCFCGYPLMFSSDELTLEIVSCTS